MTTNLILTNIDPKQLISANRKLHYQHAGKIRAYWRTRAANLAHNEYGHTDGTWHQAARIVLTVRFPDRRRHDTANLYNYVGKPIVDGLVDARVLPDDDDLHCVGPDMRRDLTRGPHQITISIQDLRADWALHLDDPNIAVADPTPGALF